MTALRTFAGITLLLGVGAAFAGSPYGAAGTNTRITALELAASIRDRRPGLRVIDVRPATEFDAYHIPTGENVLPDGIDRLPAAPGEFIVVYAEDAASTERAAAHLRSLGRANILILDGGIRAWLDDVMNPVRSTELTRYFGGTARPAGAVRTVRRGC